MAGIVSGTGLFSGINSAQIIDQLIQVESRPRALAQQRLIQIQSQQAAFLDLNSRLNALKTAAAKFGVDRVFRSVSAASTNESVLRATASAGAAPGTYQFIVDRVVSTQQLLSRGFADRAATAVGAGTLTFEPALGRLDRDTRLADLNGGQGISRGTIRITDSTGAAVTVDLSRVATVTEVIDAINAAGGGRFSATAAGDRLVLTDQAGGTGRLTVADGAGASTATSLGIAGQAAAPGTGGVLTGTRIYAIGLSTTLQSLNDGNGVRISTVAGSSNPDFTIQARDGSTHAIDIGDMYDTNGTRTATAVSTIQGLIERINSQTGGKVVASISPDGAGLTLTDTTGGTGNLVVTDLEVSGAATDLGLVADVASDTITSRRLLAGLNSTLASNLNGGAGLASGAIAITSRAGVQYAVTVPVGGSVSDIIAAINAGTSGAVIASLNATGTGLVLTDTTGGTQNLIVEGDGATALGLATAPGGVAGASVAGQRLQHRYVAGATLLSTLAGGSGIGTGAFEITNSNGQRFTVNVSASVRTVADLIGQINGAGAGVRARINDRGDGILLEDSLEQPGTIRIRVADTSGTVARSLNLAGEAPGPGGENRIDGSFERTIDVAATDTLDSLVSKINGANVGAVATVINDGSGAAPFRLSLASRLSGQAGRFTLDTGGLDLALSTLSAGDDARLFYGAADPARAVLLSSSTNQFDGVIAGLRLDARAASDDPVSITVTRDTAAIVSAVNEFISAFNGVVSRIGTLTAYDSQTRRKGALLGDSTVEVLRSNLYNTLQSRAVGVSGPFQFLSQVGIKVASGGTLTLDEDALRTALAQDSQAVADLFAAKVPTPPPPPPAPGEPIPPPVTPENQTYVSLGVAEQMVRLADQYVNSVTGVFKTRQNGFDDQVRQQNSRIADFDARLAVRRKILEQQFLRMEQAIAALQQQQSALSGLLTTGFQVR
jgi:flagellar hook-associated protein 2